VILRGLWRLVTTALAAVCCLFVGVAHLILGSVGFRLHWVRFKGAAILCGSDFPFARVCFTAATQLLFRFGLSFAKFRGSQVTQRLTGCYLACAGGGGGHAAGRVTSVAPQGH
jgi:hypothetical protein